MKNHEHGKDEDVETCIGHCSEKDSQLQPSKWSKVQGKLISITLMHVLNNIYIYRLNNITTITIHNRKTNIIYKEKCAKKESISHPRVFLFIKNAEQH